MSQLDRGTPTTSTIRPSAFHMIVWMSIIFMRGAPLIENSGDARTIDGAAMANVASLVITSRLLVDGIVRPQ